MCGGGEPVQGVGVQLSARLDDNDISPRRFIEERSQIVEPLDAQGQPGAQRRRICAPGSFGARNTIADHRDARGCRYDCEG